MGLIYNIKSTLTQTTLEAFCQKYHIPDTVHPELHGPNQSIHDSPAGKIDVYTRFFEFANFRIPLSQFLVDVLQYFHINLSQLSVIAAAKVSHFEILCRVYGFVLTIGLFRRFYVNSKSKNWMSFSKRSDNAPTLVRDPHSTATEFNAEVCDFLATHPAPFQKFVEPFLCLVGISHYYDLDENVYPTFLTTDEEDMDLFVLSAMRIPTKGGPGPSVPVGHGDHNDDVDNVGIHDLNAEGGDTELRDQTEEGGHAVQDEGVNIVADDEGLLEHSTLAVEISVTAAATMPFVASSVTHTPKREGDSSHHSSPNAEVTSIVRSFIPPPLVMTVAVATTAVVGTSFAHVLGAGTGPAIQSLFHDFASPSAAGSDTASPYNPCGVEISFYNFYVSQEMDSKTLQ
ncbi:hypothetical protein Tco_0009351 [Tanacetum coccineum]